MKAHKVHALCALALLAICMLAPGSALRANARGLASILGPGMATAFITPGEQHRIRLTKIHCSDTNEDGVFNSDEIYVILATIGPGGLLNTPRLSFFITRIYNGFDPHDNRYPNLDVLNGHIESSMVVVAQVVEHDDSEKNLIYESARVAATADFVRAVTGGTRDRWTLGGIVATSIHDAVDAAALPLVDDDDVIGPAARFIASYTTFDDLALNGASTVTRNFVGKGADYTLTFEIERTH